MAEHLSRRDVLASAAIAWAGVAIGSFTEGCGESHAPEGVAKSIEPAASSQANLNVNGKPISIQIEPRATLLDTLREDLGFTGPKKGCDHGQCGACTVLIDGRRVLSCLTLAIATQGQKITTIEGLANGDELHPVQAAFVEKDAFQCGYCTPGQICSAVGLLSEGHANTDDDIREQMAGNLCRCGAYPNIVAAMKSAMNSA